MKPSEVLAKAADLIEPEGAWTQGHFARIKPEGNSIGPLETNATCWCASGAIRKVSGDTLCDVPAHFLEEVVDESVVDWNDHPHRTQDEVVKALRDAADLARAEGQ